ncbi:AfsR/SARP family transcriptional regulator [Pseudonocardia humida]|uniref:AAA family ATPase n=1 Tax=Pseudonocardia humida TaxID=2800819 RepID=A0ABT1A694_9PSEU|nr:BTAD domain-containing putative transcriptional regulator [Pseudonocardia humida]MCO1658537.1 AAA family ATPase [Pseudonocardia humida]
MLTVELLGPLRVSVDGRPVELPRGRVRATLAVLAMSAGRATVPADRLAAAVWGAQLRGDPRTNVRTAVKRLRRALGPVGGQLVAARPGGYLLATEPDHVDALRFGRLLDEAAAATATPATERSRLDTALSLWRGTPFDGIRSDWLEWPAALELEERYLAAIERRVDLDLARGTCPQPAELAALAARHPMRESLWLRLLRVLESAGRPAEALERYEVLRRRLADELGADPGPELRRIHEALLSGGGPPPIGTVPRQLPAAVAAFAGRAAELAELDALIRPPGGSTAASPQVVVIAGMAGVGKTALAVHWAHRLAARFPDGQLHVDLRGYAPAGEAVSSAAAVRELLAALGVAPDLVPDSAAAQLGLYRSLLADRRMIVLLDNARDADHAAPLVPGAPGCLVLVTSRDHLAGLVVTHGAHPLTLDPLPADEAGRLLALRVGPARVAEDPDAVDEIVRRCSGLPLALAIVGARAAIDPAQPLGALAGELRPTLDALNRTLDVRAIFSWSYDRLGAAAARLFRLVAGLHPGPDVSVAAAAALAGLPVPRALPLLAELTRVTLLTRDASGRYSCHDLLRAYAVELCAAHDADGDGNAARHRIVEYHVDTARAAAAHLTGTGPPDPQAAAEATAWFAAERSTLLAVQRLAADLHLDRRVRDLAQAWFVALHRQGRWHDRAESQLAALAAVQRSGERTSEVRVRHDLAAALADLGRFDDAHRHLDAALERSPGEPAGHAWTHYYRSLVHGLQGDNAAAFQAARCAGELFEQLGDHVGHAIALTDLGRYHGLAGRHSEGLAVCEQALARHQALGNRPFEAHTWSCLADIHLHVGDTARAASSYRHALDLFRAIADRYAEASCRAHLGACHHLAGDQVAARAEWTQARTLLAELHPSTADQVHTQLASICRDSADAFRRRTAGVGTL